MQKILLYLTAPLDIADETHMIVTREMGFTYWRTGQATEEMPSLRIYMKSVNVDEENGNCAELNFTTSFLEKHGLGLYQVCEPSP